MRKLIRIAFKIAVVMAVVSVVRKVIESRADDQSGDATWPPLDETVAPSSRPVTADQTGAGAEPGSTWVAPDAQGGCPTSHPVKAKLSSKIFHVPDGASYGRTHADRCYLSGADAKADGLRQSKR